MVARDEQPYIEEDEQRHVFRVNRGTMTSEPIFAQSLFAASPTLRMSPSFERTSDLRSRAIFSAPPKRCSVAVTSRNASSSEIGWTSGVRSANRAMTESDAAA